MERYPRLYTCPFFDGKNNVRMKIVSRCKLGTVPMMIWVRAEVDIERLPPFTMFRYQLHVNGNAESGRVSDRGFPFLERY